MKKRKNKIVNISKMKLKEGCYYVSIGVWAYEPRILYTYIIGVYTIEIVYDYRVYMLLIPIL